MNRNMGAWDRGLRIIVGLALIVLSLNGTIGVWGWIGIIPLATGLIGRCPIYSIFGMSTCPLERKET